MHIYTYIGKILYIKGIKGCSLYITYYIYIISTPPNFYPPPPPPRPLSNNLQVKPNKNSIFNCKHWTCSIFVSLF